MSVAKSGGIQGKEGQWRELQVWESPVGFARNWLCVLEQLASPLWASSVSSPVNAYYLSGTLLGSFSHKIIATALYGVPEITCLTL